MHKLFNARARLCNGQLLKKAAQLHDERNLASGENFSDAHRRDQRQRHQYVRLDVKRRHKANDRLEHDRHAAQNDRDPRRVERANPHAAQAANDRRAGQRQQRHIFFDAAELQKRLQLFHVDPLF